MQKTIRRAISLLLVFTLLGSVLPVCAVASQELPAVSELHINPIYCDPLVEAELEAVPDGPSFLTEDADPYETIADAAACLRQGMVSRVGTITVRYLTEPGFYDEKTWSADVKAVMHEIFDAAIAHTGQPTEGDYLLWQYGGWNCRAKGSFSGDRVILEFPFVLNYYTTYEQEEEVTEEVDALLADLDLNKASDYTQVETIYDYICENVSYDYDSAGKLKHTAYAALINRTAVCQGYALLLYRLCLELGVDCRLIAGSTSGGGHGWNIVKLGEEYYNLDSTWDADRRPYRWFLRCPANFPDHIRYNNTDFAYDTEEFHASYPMADTDFTVTAIAQGECGEGLGWTLDNTGVLTVTGNGTMADYSGESPAPWSDLAPQIYEVVLDAGVTHVGDQAFAGCENIGTVSFLGDAPTFGENAFLDMDAMAEYPKTANGWADGLLQNYGGTMNWVSICQTHSYEAVVTDPTCNGRGYTTYTCQCGDTYNDDFTGPTGHSFTNYISNDDATCYADGTATAKCDNCEQLDTQTVPFSQLTHQWEDATCSDPSTCSLCGETRGEPLDHSFENGVCTACGEDDPDYVPPTTAPTEPDPTDPPVTEPDPTDPSVTEPDPTEPDPTDPLETEPPASEPQRIFGENRFQTAFEVADQLKKEMGIAKFDAIVLASGGDFADALSGSYLAAVKNAPILLGYKKGDYNAQAAEYIRANLAKNGTVYILGGTSAIPASVEDLLTGLNVKRLAGANRFETNLLVLKEAGIAPGEEILVATGTDFADCLSGSATGKPILLVYKRLMDSQKTFLPTLQNSFCIIGGENAVSEEIQTAISAYGKVERLAGRNRLETSVMVARRYFEDPDSAVIAYGWNYPDGLCGGPLAYAMKAPLILTHPKEKYYANAAEYIRSQNIAAGYVLGGEGLITPDASDAIFRK